MADAADLTGVPTVPNRPRLLAQSAKARLWHYLRNWWVMWSLQARDRKREEVLGGAQAVRRRERIGSGFLEHIGETINIDENNREAMRTKINEAASYIQKHFRFIVFMSLFVFVYIFASSGLGLGLHRFTRESITERISPDEKVASSSVPQIQDSLALLSEDLRRLQPFHNIPAGLSLTSASAVVIVDSISGITVRATSSTSVVDPIVEARDAANQSCYVLSRDRLTTSDENGNLVGNYSLQTPPSPGDVVTLTLDASTGSLFVGESLIETWTLGTYMEHCFAGNVTLWTPSAEIVEIFPKVTSLPSMKTLAKYGLPLEDFVSGRSLEGSNTEPYHTDIFLLSPPILMQRTMAVAREYCGGLTSDLLTLKEQGRLNTCNGNASNSHLCSSLLPLFRWLVSALFASCLSCSGAIFACQSDDEEGVTTMGYLREIEWDSETVNTASSEIKVMAPLYSLDDMSSNDGLLGLLAIEWTDTSASGSWKLHTIKRIRRQQMASWIAAAVLAYVACIYMLAIDFARVTRTAKSSNFIQTAVKTLYFELDIVVSFAVIVCLTLSVVYWSIVPSVFDDTFDQLLNIAWGDGTISDEYKFQVLKHMAAQVKAAPVALPPKGFFQISKYHHLRELLAFALQTCLYLILSRMVASMSAHPRIALFANTFRSAQSELIHFFISFAVLYFGLGLIAWLTFGQTMEEFESYSATLWTQFYILSSGQWFDSWENDWRLLLYIVVYMLLVYFCLLQLFLAIIVETYLMVRSDVANQQTSQTIVMETIDYYASKILWSLWGLPRRGVLVEALRAMAAKRTVDLRVMLKANIFPDLESATRFCQFYRRYDFLKPRGLVAGDSEKWDGIVDDLDEQVHRAAEQNEIMSIHQAHVVDRLEKIESALQDAVSTLEKELGFTFTNFTPTAQPPPTTNCESRIAVSRHCGCCSQESAGENANT
ncbi:hypothetical protein FOL47_004686 [Perkinsus chesapeaki]|uniref:Polycystin cation channel PKD1/PKD2 domain-containing protein n=1 Tax=Perkinsus chesapeaki TaxID=330153 RepID=A0A7J6M134_PERCH|nr:hypothetical protein FOL47_004686 [Perkinsus chesapeaki]